MAQYAIAFDLDTTAMRNAGYSQAQITGVYQQEIPSALAKCGFSQHPQGSLYHTSPGQNPITCIMLLQQTLIKQAPSFCKFVKRVHVFRMEEWSDVTHLITGRIAAGTPMAEEELAEQDAVGNF